MSLGHESAPSVVKKYINKHSKPMGTSGRMKLQTRPHFWIDLGCKGHCPRDTIWVAKIGSLMPSSHVSSQLQRCCPPDLPCFVDPSGQKLAVASSPDPPGFCLRTGFPQLTSSHLDSSPATHGCLPFSESGPLIFPQDLSPWSLTFQTHHPSKRS